MEGRKIGSFVAGVLIASSPALVKVIDMLTAYRTSFTSKFWTLLHIYGLAGYVMTVIIVYVLAGAIATIASRKIAYGITATLIGWLVSNLLLNGWQAFNTWAVLVATGIAAAAFSGIGGMLAKLVFAPRQREINSTVEN
jgi:hypothetical protein